MVVKSPPGERLAHRRVDESAADMATLEQMGVVEAQPKPEPPPVVVPPVEEPSPTEAANKTMLLTALSEAGVEDGTGDETAVALLAKLPPDTVRTVTRWLKSPKKPGTK